MVIALLGGCGDVPGSDLPRGGLPQRSLVATTASSRVLTIGSNYLSGTAWAVTRDGSTRSLPLDATGDSVVRPLGEVIAVLNRDAGQADNLTLLEERGGRVALESQSELRQADEPRGAINAHDVIALDAGTLLVARYEVEDGPPCSPLAARSTPSLVGATLPHCWLTQLRARASSEYPLADL